LPETRYSYNVDLEHPTTSQSQAVLLVPPGSMVLDIGAADGSVARPLAARGCRIWAIEADADAAAGARGACERVIVADVEELDLTAALEGQKFDFILVLDVLEHLRDPLALLERLPEHLVAGGRVIASIPNVTHGAVRLSLMSGAFNYTDAGLLDRTHLRFFDRRSAENLFTDARLRIVERLRVSRGLTETEIPIDPSAFPPSVIQKLNEDPDATTYQFLLVGKPSAGEQVPESVSLAERLQRKTETLEAQYRELERYARSVEQQHRDEVAELKHLITDGKAVQEELARIRSDFDRLGLNAATLVADIQKERDQAAEIRSELERRMVELTQHYLEQRHLKADLAVKEAFITELRQANERSASMKDAAAAQAAQAAAQEAERTRQVVATKDAAFVDLQRQAQDAERRVASLRTQLSVAQGDLARTQETLERLQVFASSAGFRIVGKATRTLNRYPRTYRVLQGMVRKVAGKPKT
jgi:2-polyprenyl-3-methyl-5-hydroxy-6-metoxy-1,4-benzoquinol methylase